MTTNKKLLYKILSQPTAPFHEASVTQVITHALTEAEVPHFFDPFGNIVIGAGSKNEYTRMIRKSSKEPLRIFMAHMDHPGFHGVAWKTPDMLKVKWFGGSPTKFLEGAGVWVSNDKKVLLKGRLTRPEIAKHGKSITTALIRFHDKQENREPASSYFGGFGFRSPVWQKGKTIYTKAADDLVGVFAVLSLAIKLAARIRAGRTPFLAIITRAEEVGFIGAIAHFSLGWTKNAARPLLSVSVECSRELPGAEIGKGPVVRLGDRFTVFDPAALQVFSRLAQESLPGFHQRKLMDGGTCEASAAMAFGIPAIGISIPLGNYHNQCFAPLNMTKRSKQKIGGPAPEYVNLDDVSGTIKLGQALMEPGLRLDGAYDEKTKQFLKSVQNYRKFLFETR